MAPRADRLFRRFRRTGDPAALAAVFDRTAPEVLRVAIHLAGGPAEAEDLVQETFVTAIESAAAWDERRPVLPWLLGILANRARKARERSARTPAPERLRQGTVADPAEEAQRTEFSEDLDRAIRALPEPYPSVLVLHLRYGHSAAEIADALHRPPGTVRTQIVRGFEILRRTLPAGHRVAAFASVRRVRGLAAVREAVVREATMVAAGTVSATSVSAPSLLGVIAMKKTWSAVGVVLLATGAWLAWPEPEGARPERVVEPPRAVAATRPAANEPVLETTTRTAELPDHRVAVSAATSGSVLLRVRWGDDETPAGEVEIVVTPSQAESALHRRHVRTGPDGVVKIEDLRPVSTSFEADRGGSAKVQVVAGETSELELEIPRGLDLSGVVVDPGGNPVAGARVWLSRAPADIDEGREVAVVGRDGAFRLRCVQPGRFVSAFAEGFVPARLVKVEGKPGDTLHGPLVLGGPAGRLRGRVLDPEGRPVPSALILVGSSSALTVHYAAGHPLAPTAPGLSFRTDAQGEFVADGVTAGSSYPVWARAAGFAPTNDGVRVRERGETAVEVRLRRGATLAGTAAARDGTPVRVHVEVLSKETEPTEGMAWMGPAWARPHGFAEEDGRFRIEGIYPGPARVTAGGRGGVRAAAVLNLADETVTLWDPVLSQGTEIRGTVVSEAGRPLEGWTVHARAPYPFRSGSPSKTDVEGRFVIEKNDDCAHTLTAHDETILIKHAATKLEDVWPGTESVTLRVPDCEIASAFLTGRCLDPDGKPPKGTSFHARRRGPDPYTPAAQQYADGKVDEEGRFRLGPLPSGVYDVRTSSKESGATITITVRLEAGQTNDLGVLQLERPGSLVAEIKDCHGNPLPAGSAYVEQGPHVEMPFGSQCAIQNGVAQIVGLAAGKYVFHVMPAKAAKHPVQEVEVEIRSGEETKIQVNLPRGVMHRLRKTATTKRVPFPLEFVWTGPDGKVWYRHVSWWTLERETDAEMCLVPGSHSVTVRAMPGGEPVTSRFHVSEDGTGEPAVIRLP